MKQITRWMLALLAIVGLGGTFAQAQQALTQSDNSLPLAHAHLDDVLNPTSDGRTMP